MSQAVFPPRQTRRRRFTVSLRVLMLLVLIAAIGLGWRVTAPYTARAVARIKKAGGDIYYDYEFDQAYHYKQNASPWAPPWLRRAVGDEYFQEVAEVHFGRNTTDDQLAVVEDLDRLIKITLSEVTDARLMHLRHVKSLRIAHLNGTDITDAGLAHLAGLPDLQELSVWTIYPGITDVGLAHLAGLPHLQELSVRGICADITDVGMAHVARMTELRTLRVHLSTEITDIGVAQIAKLPHLQKLKLYPVTDAAGGLASLTELQELDLSYTNINDAGVRCLKDMKKLCTLNLEWNRRITNNGLAPLAGLGELRNLNLSENNVTEAGLRHLRGLRQLRKLELRNVRINALEVAAFAPRSPD